MGVYETFSKIEFKICVATKSLEVSITYDNSIRHVESQYDISILFLLI